MNARALSWLRLGGSLVSSVAVLVYFHWWQERLLHPSTTPQFTTWLLRSVTFRSESSQSENVRIIDVKARNVCRVRRDSSDDDGDFYVCETCGTSMSDVQAAFDHVAASRTVEALS